MKTPPYPMLEIEEILLAFRRNMYDSDEEATLAIYNLMLDGKEESS